MPVSYTHLEEIVQQLTDGDYSAVLAQFRSDIREGLTAEQLQTQVETATQKAGQYRKLDDTLVTGSQEPEPHGIAVIYCKYTKDSVMFRVAFDPEMELDVYKRQAVLLYAGICRDRRHTQPHRTAPGRHIYPRRGRGNADEDRGAALEGDVYKRQEVNFDDKRRVVDLMISAIYATSESINIVWKI